MKRGVIIRVRLFLIILALTGGLSAQAGKYSAGESSCHGDHMDDLDTGLGLLAEQRTVVTVRRASVSLDCEVAAEPQFGNLTFVWKFRGEKIQSRSPRSRRYTYPNGTLHIRKVVHRMKAGVRVSDEGIYECYVSNSVGTVIAQIIHLVVASLGKKFVAQPASRGHKVGDNLYLPCQIHASPSNLMVVWHKDNALLKINDNPRYRTTQNGLLILNSQLNDSGSYHCQATNKEFFALVHDMPYSHSDVPYPVQWRNSQPASIVVTADDRDTVLSPFLLTPGNVTEVPLGDSVDILCVASTFDTPSVTTWTRADRSNPDVMMPIDEKLSAEFSVLPCGSLRIRRVHRELGGMYTCTHTASGLSMSTLLSVLEKPVIEDSSPSCVYPLASVVRLDCIVSAQPPPSLLWLKDGVQVVPVRFRVEFVQEALFIYQGNTADSGYYQCLVRNKAGWALSLTRVAVKIKPDAPSAPRNVTGEAVSSSRIMVRWEMEGSSKNLLSYSVHRRLAREEGGEEAEIVEGQRRSATLDGLLPDTLYAVTIRAYNKGGAGPSSEPVFIRTDLTGYPSPALTYAGNSSIFLNWTDFHTRHRRRHLISAYHVHYGPSNAAHIELMELNATYDTLLISDLEENREYRVRMKAVFMGENSDIHDEIWPWGYIRVGNTTSLPKPDSHLAAPFNLRAMPLEPSAISLSWTYSGDSLQVSLPVTHYTVRYQQLETHSLGASCRDAVAARSVILKTTRSNMATLDKLKAFTLYNISVSAHSDNLQGPYSRPILVQTKEDVPSRPENLKAQVVSEGQVLLQWQPPTWPNGLIRGHYIQYINHQYSVIATNGDFANATWVQLYQQGNKTQATVNNLTKRFYMFQVQACTNAGRGESSTLVFVHMGDNVSGGRLSDQHLGILGGSVIGLTSIIVTVIVIICKQRQLKKQLEKQYLLEQRRQLSTAPHHHPPQSPTSLTLHLTPSATRSEELENLLNGSAPYSSAVNSTSTAAADTDSRDSGCSSIPAHVDDRAVRGDKQDETGCDDDDDDYNSAETADLAILTTRQDQVWENVRSTPCGAIADKETIC